MSERFDIFLAALGVFGTLTGVFLGYYISIEPDFGVSIDPPQHTINKLGSHNVSVTLFNLHSSEKYSHQIILRLYNMENFSLPAGITNVYDPLVPSARPLAEKEEVVTHLNIRVDATAVSKEYPLRILAIGSDGKQRSCPFILLVPNIQRGVLN